MRMIKEECCSDYEELKDDHSKDIVVQEFGVHEEMVSTVPVRLWTVIVCELFHQLDCVKNPFWNKNRSEK